MLDAFKKRRRLFTIATVMLVAAVVVVLFVPEARAQVQQLSEVGAATGLPETDIRVVVARIIRTAILLVGIIFFAIVVYGGFIWMTSAGEAEKINRAKAILRNGAIGLVIILSSYAIASFVLNALLGGGIFSPISSQTPTGVEPLSGSLGSGIIQDHWPQRGAMDIPRNTKIIITFKEPIAIESMGVDQVAGVGTPEIADDVYTLNDANVLIYKNVDEEAGALAPEQVNVMTTEDQTIWVFDPVELLGSALEETNYTVVLENSIMKADGTDAFTGSYSGGYEWSFEVSTLVDLTPPYVRSVNPAHDSEKARNIVVQVNFNEAMDPTAVAGVFQNGSGFTNLIAEELLGNDQTSIIEGTWTISNAYRTVEFVTFDACGEDPCGDPIFCLPANIDLQVTAYAATLGAEPPEAAGFPYDGAVDIAGNSLDGGNNNHNDSATETSSANGTAEGPDIDNYVWAFSTTGDTNDIVPSVYRFYPTQDAEEVALDSPVEVYFWADDGTGTGPGVPMMSSTLNNSNIGIVPVSNDPQVPTHELSYRIDVTALYEGEVEEPPYENAPVVSTMASIDHGLFLESDELVRTWDYYPFIFNGVKSAYQICYYPAQGPGSANPATGGPEDCDVDNTQNPSCCEGQASPNCSL
ncbi:MAG: hypothetical protein ABIG32_00775 [Candidatus Uhrbacteria bacterium]|nr:hypothetical protein [Patescibacteria group bacterium]MBU1907377.1 hypothetical protein [Patescibacteria group bacterium]